MTVTYGFIERLRKKIETEVEIVNGPLLAGKYQDMQSYSRQAGKREGLLLTLNIVEEITKAMNDPPKHPQG